MDNQNRLSKREELTIPIPMNEMKRMKLLNEAMIFDTIPEENYDRYTSMAARMFKVPMALVSLIDVNRQWFKSKVGLPATETHRNIAFCSYAILEETPSVMIVPNALKDPRFALNPLVLGPPFLRFYAGASLIVDGVKVGTLCIADTVIRESNTFGPKEATMLEDLAQIISNLLQQRRKDNLSNIYQTLVMNAEIMKLFQIPLHNLNQSKETIQRLYSSLQEIYGSIQLLKKRNQDYGKQQGGGGSTENDQLLMKMKMRIHQLIIEIQLLSKEVNRLLPMSSILTKLFIEIYHLEQYDSLTDFCFMKSTSSLQPSSDRKEEENHSLQFQSLTKMNIPSLQSKLKEYYHISHHQSLNSGLRIQTTDLCSSSSAVSSSGLHISWKLDQLFGVSSTQSESITPTSKKGENMIRNSSTSKRTAHFTPQYLYSYPTLMELVLMTLFDFFDRQSHHKKQEIFDITIEPILQNSSNKENINHSLINSGHWVISVSCNKVLNDNLMEVFSIINRVTNCTHYIYKEEEHQTESYYQIYKIEIPFYDFQVNALSNHDPHLTIAKKVVLPFRDESPTAITQHPNISDDQLPLHSNKRIKPSSSTTTTSSAILSFSFQFFRQHWKRHLQISKHQQLQQQKGKVFICSSSSSSSTEEIVEV